MKNNFFKSLIIVSSLIVVSCESFLDVNGENPNNLLLEKVTPDLALAAAQTQTYRVISGDNRNVEGNVGLNSLNQLGNVLMNSWAGNVNDFGDPYGALYRSDITSSLYRQIWEYSYYNIANLDNIANYSGTDYDRHKAIGKILKSFYMQNIVDLYGDCPYSEAFQGNDNLTPKYDDDKNVYRALYADLDAAINLINSADSNDKVVGAEDVVCNGNMQKWVRFANTIKLRMIIRQSALPGADAAYVTNELNNLATSNDFLLDDVTINPGFNSANSDAFNPFYAAYGFGVNGVAVQQEGFVSASKNAATKLNSTSDARRARLFRLVSGVVVGIEQGEGAITAPDNFSKLGPAVVPTTVATGAVLPGYMMTLSEVKFLLAEAAILNPSFGVAQTFFEDGIRASFIRLGVGTTAALSNTAATAYITSVASSPGVGGAVTIQSIMYQKWISLMHVSAHQSWFDYVRTGFPITPNALSNTLGAKPKRLMYPNSEVQSNATNVPAQTAATVISTGPFWKI